MSWIHLKNRPENERSEKWAEHEESFLPIGFALFFTWWGCSYLKPPPVSQLILEYIQWISGNDASTLIERADMQQCCHGRLGNRLLLTGNSLVKCVIPSARANFSSLKSRIKVQPVPSFGRTISANFEVANRRTSLASRKHSSRSKVRKRVLGPFLVPHSFPVHECSVMRGGEIVKLFVVRTFDVVSEARSVNKMQCTSRKLGN